MPAYITRPGGHDTTYPAPSTATGVDLCLYLLKTSHATVAATLNRYLNPVAPAGVTFVPLGRTVVACFSALGKVVANDPALGFMREIDVAFFVPTVRFDGLIPTRIVFFAPYLFVDIPQAAATGREVHGYRKDMGTSFSTKDIYDPLWVPNAADLTHVEAWAVPAPSTALQRTKLVELVPPATPPAPPAPPAAWSGYGAALLEFLGVLMDDLTALAGTVSTVLGNHPTLTEALLGTALTALFKGLLGENTLAVPILFLRQFRNPAHNDQADVQELLLAETILPLSQLSGGKLPGNYSLIFHDAASHPFSVELGTTSGVPMDAILAAHASCTFTLQEATHL